MTKSAGIGVFGAAAIGIGGMVGGGIFAVLGTAVATAGGATPVAFLVAGGIAALTAYSYSKLSVRYPSAGGTVVFLDRAFGVDLFTGTLNVVLWLAYLVTIALYASAFGSYALTFFDDAPAWAPHALMTAGICLPAAINILNAEIVSKSETVIVLIKLTLLAVVVVAGLPFVDGTRMAPSTWEAPLQIVLGGLVIFVAYEGFELIANAAADVRDPTQTLPRAYLLCVGFVIVLYVLVAVVTVGTVSPERIAEVQDYALAEAARPALGRAGFTIVALSALLATFSAINATIYGNARLGFTLATDRELPEVFEKQTFSRPLYGVLLTAGLSALLANLVDLQAIAIIGSASFLLVFAVTNAAAVRLAGATGGNRWISLAGALACAGALVALMASTAREDPTGLCVFLGMIGAALLFELVYPRLAGKPLRIR